MNYLKVLFFGALLIITSTLSAAPALPKSLTPGGPSGYMGLWDWGASVGFLKQREARPLVGNAFENTKVNGQFLSVHFQESLLSNYFWATKQDKKIKFGVVELLELGLSYAKTTVTTTIPSNPGSAPSSKLGFLFSYEGGIGGVYKINDKIDAGMNYYFLSLSSFNNPNGNKIHFAKFRFRYSHLMCELSALGKKALDIKYMRKGDEDRSYTPYIGFTYTGWKVSQGRVDGQYTNQRQYFYLTIGGVF